MQVEFRKIENTISVVKAKNDAQFVITISRRL